MNNITRHSINSLGYNFVPKNFLPPGKDEYHLRNLQNKSGIDYRKLSAQEIEMLVRNRNQSDDWNKILVSDAFNPELVKNCKFYGLIRIGKLEPFFLEFKNLRMPVGLYNSTIISCDIGDNVVIDNVNYLGHYIIGNEVIIVNVNELATTPYAKFGNGISKDGEDENLRIWLELRNENGGRSVIPFNGMLPGDAYLWSEFRADHKLLEQFKKFTEDRFDKQRGYYGKIGDRSVIKNTSIIKDVWIGSDAYIKGANKLKNLTINSSPEASTQIGEGCELVNGIIDFGCRIFYGVKAVRFVMASQSQLKYGARLINSYLGNNATISCCEVLNSLIFPAHEQHHNNSFLCAAMIMGQSNIAAGATIGSNHNSRGADGELIAGRGFWPGLCVSLKHNSKFASFTILAKGDFPAELNIPVPFSLVSNNVQENKIVVMPAYWFLYNMYALARNAWKYEDRDKRTEKIQQLEYNYLAPDSATEIAAALPILETAVGNAWLRTQNANGKFTADEALAAGQKLLHADDPAIDELNITVEGWENSDRPTTLIKVREAWKMYRCMLNYYAVNETLALIEEKGIQSWKELSAYLPPANAPLSTWTNVGGQLMTSDALNELISSIRDGRINGWFEVHRFYSKQAERYQEEKTNHALVVWKKVSGHTTIEASTFRKALEEALKTREWIFDSIYKSREKDYKNPFRMMVYNSEEERDEVIGKLEDNSFIRQEKQGLDEYRQKIDRMNRIISQD